MSDGDTVAMACEDNGSGSLWAEVVRVERILVPSLRVKSKTSLVRVNRVATSHAGAELVVQHFEKVPGGDGAWGKGCAAQGSF